jgi:hypothetical protein
MRTRIKSRVNVSEVVEQIDNEIKSYKRAIKIIMVLNKVAYRDAKMIFRNKINERLIFKN